MRHLKVFLIGLAMVVSACGGGNSPSGPGQPSIASGSPPSGMTGTAYPGYTFAVASGGAPPFTWTETGALPPGLTLSPAGFLAGNPTTAGGFAFTVKVADSSTPALTATLSVSVKIESIVVTGGQVPPAGVHGTPYGYTFLATGGNPPLSWTVTAGTLPPGLTLDSDGTLNGTPTQASSTPFGFTLTVADGSKPMPASNSSAYSISVSEPLPPSINNALLPMATVGTNYSFQFTASDGLNPLVWTPPTTPTGGLTVGVDGILSGTPSTAGIFPITLTVTDALNRASLAAPFTVRVALARPAAAFVSTGNMIAARDGHTATLLLDGRVLIAGGGLASAEIYDVASQTFSATGHMSIARFGHSATLLANSSLPNHGKILMAGGGELTAELFDPSAGTFTATGSMQAQHLGQTATLLQNGQILIAGGETAKAELFNPSTASFAPSGNMVASRSGHTATLLPDGRVLISGGVLNFGDGGTAPVPAGPGDASAEIYDPVSGTFTSTGSMSEGRAGHMATLLLDGTVLVEGPASSTAELFNPATRIFSRVGELSGPRCGQATATLRNDGTVLVAGGRSCGRGSASRAMAELFAPESGGFADAGSLITARDGHAATRLLDGTVLITGGTQHTYKCVGGGYFPTCTSGSQLLSSAEVFK